MKIKLILVPLLMFVLSIPAFAEVNTESIKQEYDFRQINWGMNQQQVIESEKNKLLHQDNKFLIYDCIIDNKDCMLIYQFEDNKLINAGYLFQINHTNLNSYIDDYTDLHNLLKNKYHEPVENKIIWKNNLFKNSPSDYGMAIGIGHLEYTSNWITETTKIGLHLTGDNYQINLILIYMDKNYVKKTPATEGL